jgi:tetratricopeptide (TPR) repeat protein
MAKDKSKISRRNLLFGGFKALRRENEWEAIAREQAQKGDKAQDEKKARQSGARLTLAEVAQRQGRLEDAVSHYRLFVKDNPDHAKARRELGRCLYQLGQYIQAKVEFERVLRIVEDDSEACLYLGLCNARLGKKDKAMVAWRTYFNPQNIPLQRELNLQIGLLETDGTDPESAAQAVEEVMAAELDQQGTA